MIINNIPKSPAETPAITPVVVEKLISHSGDISFNVWINNKVFIKTTDAEATVNQTIKSENVIFLYSDFLK